MRSKLRGLLPGLLFVVVLPLTLVLIIVAIGATTLHQNEMRNLVAANDQHDYCLQVALRLRQDVDAPHDLRDRHRR